MIEQFTIEVHEGLSGNPKTLPSKYFYDKNGDELFIKIMQLPEYYLTRSELEIFQTQAHNIVKILQLQPLTYFELIELGAGDGLKTTELIKVLIQNNFQFEFLPVDISANALNLIEEKLKSELPEIPIKKMQGDYFNILDSLKETNKPKVILFLGSNIGNMDDEQAAGFLIDLGKNLSRGDKLLLGADLIKPASIVLPAYNDTQGVTREFNLNLLRRINNELGANFRHEAFEHVPEYSETDGHAKSFLESKEHQEVSINRTGNTYVFRKGERILTEISRKYNDAIIDKLFRNTPFTKIGKITDQKEYFASYIFNKV